MKKSEYENIESYMLECMKDSAHDKEHIYRVLYMALDIAKHEKNVDLDFLIAACLLHDIGRGEQFRNPALSHAQVCSEKAYQYLFKNDWPEKKAAHVRECILTHSFRSGHFPESIEAKILFDADKLDATGTLGIGGLCSMRDRFPNRYTLLMKTGTFQAAKVIRNHPSCRSTSLNWKSSMIYFSLREENKLQRSVRLPPFLFTTACSKRSGPVIHAGRLNCPESLNNRRIDLKTLIQHIKNRFELIPCGQSELQFPGPKSQSIPRCLLVRLDALVLQDLHL